ncbi:MAG TPA: YebC/PmpR family DNA-binding transcriptional regulator [Pirellulaceae bacterium]|nr:YebC/PmpR family DNA-binding transcriptional regulator [Pirellulaceae bacterium]HMO92165.1 YebC/PmpR family DNA-binding transcriptional regulator [Pirellulaceae bacterium]HMP68908.1 YebC/PmpR family DNA-binding transcriptional regulator [Pirellulaceae bacterium]
MAGHSKWANIQHRKGRVDAQRAKVWTRLSRAIIVAARDGADLNGNFRLRKAVEDAKAASMPKDNIERAIKRGTGELDGGNLDEIVYEGYGPHGVAIILDILTDNRNRTAPELRKLFEIHQGKLAESGAVSWIFNRKGLFIIPRQSIEEESLMTVALDAGADDIQVVGDNFEVTCDPDQFSSVNDRLKLENIECESAQVLRIPSNTVTLDAEAATQVLKLMEALDDHGDVQSVSANFDIPDEAMAQLKS